MAILLIGKKKQIDNIIPIANLKSGAFVNQTKEQIDNAIKMKSFSLNKFLYLANTLEEIIINTQAIEKFTIVEEL